MAGASNSVLATLNAIFLIAGVALLGCGVYFHSHYAATVCQQLIVNSLLVVGVFACVISVLGLCGSCCGSNCVLGLYMLLMFLLLAGLSVFAVFVFLVTNDSAGKAVSGHGVGNYSHWLRNHFTGGKNWDVFKSCLVDAQFCNSLASHPRAYNDFIKSKIPTLQGECCMPPRECEFEYRNATVWTAPERAGLTGDCRSWSNKQNELCFNCDTCKAGFLSSIKKQWRKVGISFIALIVFCFIVFSIAARAAKNNAYRYRCNFYNRRSYV